MTSPEHIAMLNGRMAALQAATADLLERGALRPDGRHNILAGPAVPGMTGLQHAIHQAVADGSLHLERDPRVVAELDLLQRDCVRRGLLRPPRTSSKPAGWLTLLLLVGVFAVVMVVKRTPPAMLLIPLAIGAVAAVALVRSARGPKDRRTKAGIAALQQARATAAPNVPLGVRVGAFGTRPLLTAFPAAAALGWPLTDFDDPNVQALRWASSGNSGYSCSSSSTGEQWCSGGNTCGSGGSCNSGSCSGGSCSSGGCGGGSSCGSSCSS